MKTKPMNRSTGLSAWLGLTLAAAVCAVSLPSQAALPDVTADYTIETIPSPPDATITEIFCVFMNDSGMVAMQCNTVNNGAPGSSQGLTAVLEKSVWTVINVPNSAWTGCGNPTASGVVPLCYGTSDGSVHNALYHKGTYKPLPDWPLPWQCGVQCINDNLIMTGVYWNPVGTCSDAAGNPCEHGVLMNPSLSLFKEFAYPGADTTAPLGLNNALQIVGCYLNPDGSWHAFFSEAGKTFLNIDPPGLATIASAVSSGWMINNQGEICGIYTDGATGVQQSFLLRKGKFSAFQVVGSSSTTVNCITDNGKLSGYYVDKSGNSQAFIATPKPGH